MKRIIVLSVCLLTAFVSVDAQKEIRKISEYPAPEIDFSVLESMPHPRVLVNAGSLAELKRSVQSPRSEDFRKLNAMQIAQADRYVSEHKTLVYRKDASNKRILSVSRDALSRIFACAYAYAVTGERVYLDCASHVMEAVCAFGDWNPDHYLDTAEMGLAVAIGYDWMYDDLDPAVRERAAEKLYEYVICTTLDSRYEKRCFSVNNWNQVCNAGVTAAALALYDRHPEQARKVISRALPANARAVDILYSPEGVYPEGAGYWLYGTSFQIVLNTLLVNAFGTDFGLSDNPGFKKTPTFLMYSQGNFGLKFDYSDTNALGTDFPDAWYFADRYGNSDYLYLIHRSIAEGKANCKARLSPLNLIYASRFDGRAIESPKDRVYHGKGEIPVVIARTGWGKNDRFLGVKAGYAYSHSHLDSGSFVYEADGVRWASELHSIGGYAPIEKLMKKIDGASLWSRDPDSWRWKVFSYSNREHNTVTVNGKDYLPYAVSEFISVIDEPSRIGGSVNLTPVFGGEVRKAVRTVVIRDDTFLEITDEISAPEDSPAVVSFNLVTDAVPAADRKGITLTSGDRTATLSAKGARVSYEIRSVNPADYPNAVNSHLKTPKNKAMCGYTYKVPAGKTVTVVTTLK